MPIFYCKTCAQKMRAADRVIGKQCRCKKCNTLVTIPAVDEPAPASLAAQSDEPPPLPTSDDAGVPPPLPSLQTDNQSPVPKATTPSIVRRRPAARHTGLLIGAAAAALLLVAGIWYATRPSARDAIVVTGRGSTANAHAATEATATSDATPTVNTTERDPQALKERCFEWLQNWSVAFRGEQPTWQFQPQSAVEQSDRELIEKEAAYSARTIAELRASAAASRGQLSKEPLPPTVDWTAQDSEKIVALRDKISEWGYAILCETKTPAAAAAETAQRMDAGRVEDILKAKHAGDKPPEDRTTGGGASISTNLAGDSAPSLKGKETMEKMRARIKSLMADFGQTPYAALSTAEAEFNAPAFADKIKAEMLASDPNIFGGGDGGKRPSMPDSGPATIKSPTPGGTAPPTVSPSSNSVSNAPPSSIPAGSTGLGGSIPPPAPKPKDAADSSEFSLDAQQKWIASKNKQAKDHPDGMDPATIKKPPAEKALPTRAILPMLNGWTSVMRNYIKMKDVKHAKDYAQKIIKDYPNTPEADEAKTVIEMKE